MAQRGSTTDTSQELRNGVIRVAGRPTPYAVRRSARARRAALHIHPRDGLQVILPSTAPPSEVHALLREKRDWLQRHHEELERAARSRVPLGPGVPLPYRGRWLPLQIEPAPRPGVRRHNGSLVVAARDPDSQDDLRATLERWYRHQARRVLLDRIQALRQPSEPPVRRLAVRDQDTRWGSCSSAGTLSFNWRLVMTPPPVLDAVVAHELVHLTIPDHSPRFWSSLDGRFPRHRACRRWLDANAYRLGF